MLEFRHAGIHICVSWSVGGFHWRFSGQFMKVSFNCQNQFFKVAISWGDVEDTVYSVYFNERGGFPQWRSLPTRQHQLHCAKAFASRYVCGVTCRNIVLNKLVSQLASCRQALEGLEC